ncbi:MAG: YceI family protein [Lewinellaceae bacterium]|nr:YceI family protein [Lewinellaceae bacterium]
MKLMLAPLRNTILGVSFFLAAMATTSFSVNEARPFQILPDSQLYLKGTSNVAPFTCNCQQNFPPLQYSLAIRPKNQLATFQNTSLQLETKKLDCGNRGMNRDMHQTLKASEYPTISIRLEEVQWKANQWPDEPQSYGSLAAKATLSVAGVSRLVKLNVNARETGKDTYRFVSELAIKMTDFGIDPPTALMGLIKVDDKILIHLDLAVRIEEAAF